MPEARTIAVPDTKEIRTLAEATLKAARDIVIKDDPSYTAAGAFLGALKGREKSIDNVLDPFVKNNYDSWQSALALKAQHMAPVKEAEGIVKEKIKAYRIEAEKRNREEEARLREEARKADEDERLRRAEELLAAGRPEDVLALLEGTPEPTMIVAHKALPKVKNIVARDSWKAELIDLTVLNKAVAEGKVPINFIQANMTTIGSVVRSLSGNIEIPGVRVYSEEVIAGGDR